MPKEVCAKRAQSNFCYLPQYQCQMVPAKAHRLLRSNVHSAHQFDFPFKHKMMHGSNCLIPEFH